MKIVRRYRGEMLCRALLTALALSYLICVLLLSGVQKDDLDVSTLRKLQRHNVSLNDLDNATLRQECLANLGNKNYKHKNYEENTTANLNFIENKDSITNTELSNKTQLTLESMVQFLTNQREVVDAPYITEDSITLPVIKQESTQTERSSKNNNLKHDTTVEIIKDITEIEYDKGLPKLESVIKFWQIYAKTNKPKIYEYKTTESPKILTTTIIENSMKNTEDMINTFQTVDQNNIVKEISKFNNTSKEVEYISKIIADYVSRKSVTPIQTQSTTTEISLDLNKISQQISLLLTSSVRDVQSTPYRSVATKRNITNLKNDNSWPTINTNLNKYILPQNQTTIKANDTWISTTNAHSKGQTVFKTPTIKNIYDISRNANKLTDILTNTLKDKHDKRERSIGDVFNVPEINQFNSYASFIPNQSFAPPNLFENNINLQRENVKTIPQPLVDYYTSPIQSLYTKTDDIRAKQIRMLPPDVIREIAENVKAIVLKDLKKEMLTTNTITTLSTTTVSTVKTTQKQEQMKTQEASKVIEKFMELFEQLKSTKERTAIADDAKLKSTENKNTKHKVSVKTVYPTFMPKINPYKTQPNKMYDFKNITLANTPINTFTLFNNKATVHTHELHAAPITIQTNSDEVPPLGIPLSKPLKLINQNIIVTTRHPFYNQHHYNVRHDDISKYNDHPRYEREKDKRTSSKMFNPFEKDPVRYNYKLTNSYRDNTRVGTRNKDFKYNIDYNDMKNHEYQYYKSKHYNNYDHKSSSHNIKNFHEKLERVDEWRHDSREPKYNFEDTADYCNPKLVPRHQLPLNVVKKTSSYDDTHFRNFLKTQQKVNDMLERILATKTKMDGPRSVETT